MRGNHYQAGGIGAGAAHRRGRLVRIEVDRNRCEGHAMCEAAAPRFFSVDDEGALTIRTAEVSESDKVLVQGAVLSCPVAALKLSSQ
ncbi:ferredoxin [Nocardia vinacea]|uniref:ferredoxin n=1 Tax=Nocardia vinacea TaxID=96468 RepID=UPI002479B5B1|nr:ferredoxin [Nocardia vinacea]